MFNGAVAMAKVDGHVVLVQVVQSSRTSSHLEVLKYAYFGDRSFLANITSTPPIRIPASDIVEFLPSHIKPASKDLLILPEDFFNQWVAQCTANQSELEAKWQRAMAAGATLQRA